MQMHETFSSNKVRFKLREGKAGTCWGKLDKTGATLETAYKIIGPNFTGNDLSASSAQNAATATKNKVELKQTKLKIEDSNKK